jgi:hypothetical protein
MGIIKAKGREVCSWRGSRHSRRPQLFLGAGNPAVESGCRAQPCSAGLAPVGKRGGGPRLQIGQSSGLCSIGQSNAPQTFPRRPLFRFKVALTSQHQKREAQLMEQCVSSPTGGSPELVLALYMSIWTAPRAQDWQTICNDETTVAAIRNSPPRMVTSSKSSMT